MCKIATVVILLASLAATAAGQASTTVVATPLRSFSDQRLAYDAVRRRVVTSIAGSPAWEHDGVAWVQRDYVLPAGTLVYDSTRERLVVVGSAGVVACDGNSTAVIGPPLAALAVAVDAHRARLVAVVPLPPGVSEGLELWEFDGFAWTAVARIDGRLSTAGMAFDAARRRTVLCVVRMETPGGREYWEWDGAGLTGPLLVGLALEVMSFEPRSRQVLVAGGSGLSLWDGTALTPVSSNREDRFGRTCLDEANGRVLRDWGNAVSAWTGSSWLDLALTTMPYVGRASFTYDTHRGRAVLLGAPISPGVTRVHAEWDGVRWDEVPIGSSAPPTLFLHAQAFDAARGETVVFGGSTGIEGRGAPIGTTYAWNGASWRLAASTGPGPRRGAAMTYDAARQRVVMCGGRDHTTRTTYADHWEWDGVSWTLVAPSTPMAGSSAVLGYDPVRRRVVSHALDGGTYEFDGVAWARVHVGGPILSYGAVSPDLYNQVELPSFAWHAASQRLVATVIAGSTHAVSGWNGFDWQPVGLPIGLHAGIPPSGAMLTAFHDLRLVSDVPAQAASFGVGCGGRVTATSLSAHGRPVLGNALLHLDLRADARSAIGLIAFGDRADRVSLGDGCTLLVGGLFATLYAGTNTSGFGRLPLTIPVSPALRGAVVVTQGLVFDPRAPRGVALSQGLTLTLGD